MADSALIRNKNFWDFIFPEAKLVAKHFQAIAKANLEVDKDFNFTQHKESGIFWTEVPIIKKKIPNTIRDITPELREMHEVDFHVRIQGHNDTPNWMNMFPKIGDRNDEFEYFGLLSIGFSKRTKNSVDKTNKTNQWYTGSFRESLKN